jgi:hypothetical protein
VPDALRTDLATTSPPRGIELALPPEFRARLDALVRGAQRPALAAIDPGSHVAAAGPLPAATPATAIGAAAPADGLPDTLPALQPLADPDAFAQGLGERMLLMAEKGLQSATLRLQPEHLGPVEIRISVDDDGAARVVFSAHHAQTRDALESTIPRLRELFSDQGLNLQQANVDAGGRGFGQRAAAQGLPDWNVWLGSDRLHADVDKVVALHVGRSAERRLDVLV